MRELLFIKLPGILAGLCLLAGIGVNFANVVGRYFFGAPIFWAEEAMIFLIIWSVFLGFVAVTANAEHLKMDLVSSLLSPGVRGVLERLAMLVAVIVMIFMLMQSWNSISRLWQFGMRSISLDIPMVVPHAAVLVGFVGSATAAILILLEKRG